MSYDSFCKYDKDSDEITLMYELENVHDRKGETCQLSHYKEEFSSIINNNKFKGYGTFKKSDSFLKIKEKISEITGFPKDVMVGFSTSGKNDIDENGKSWHYLEKYEVNDSLLIKDSKYNHEYSENRQLYLWIDIDKSPNFKLANEIQLKNDETFKNINIKYNSLITKYNDLENKYNDLNVDNILNINKLKIRKRKKRFKNNIRITKKSNFNFINTN